MTTKSTYEELEQRVKESANEAFDRKQAEEALRESERYLKFYKFAVDSMEHSKVAILDRDSA